MIAGYNTMSEEEKANVDVVGLSTMMRNSLIIIEYFRYNTITKYESRKIKIPDRKIHIVKRAQRTAAVPMD